MHNYWLSYNHSFALWNIVFPKEAIKINPAILFRFTEQFCLMCDVYHIAQLEKISNPIANWNHSSEKSYFEHLQEVYETTGKIPFFYHHPNMETPIEELRIIKTRICFHTKDGIGEEKVYDLGYLRDKLPPSIRERSYNNPPVDLWGNRIIPDALDLNAGWQPRPSLTLMLASDIWLPFIYGWGMEEDEAKPRIGLISNESLANCHTRRFNNWLKEVKSLAIDWGASWEFELQGFESYQAMLNEDGINLNYQAAET